MGSAPEQLKDLALRDLAVARWLGGLRAVACLALDHMEGCRQSGAGYTYDAVAGKLADRILEARGPAITEPDAYSADLDTVDEIPMEVSDGDE